MKRLVLVGNPNTGKTTIFNTLTKSAEKASNWHGVTVEEKTKKVKILGEEILVVDLPGINSLYASSPEERVSTRAILKYANHGGSMFAIICDANNLVKNLLLAYQMKSVGLDFVLIVNMINEVVTDVENLKKALEQEFGTTCFFVDGRKKKHMKTVLTNILGLVPSAQNKFLENQFKQIENGDNFERDIQKFFDKGERLISKCNIVQKNKGKIDKFLLRPWVSILLFLVVFVAVFWIVFGPFGSLLASVVEKYVVGVALEFVVSCAYLAGAFVGDFAQIVLVTGVGSVLCFLPQIVLLFLLLSLLEDIGLLARFAYTLDAPFRRVGLSGRSVFSILSGFGCTTSAVLVTRNLENKKLQRRTALALPFFGCSAKIPILLVVSSLFFEKYKFLCVFLVYLISILLCFLILFLTNLGGKKKQNPFLMEMPPLRLPNLKKIYVDTKANFLSFSGRTLSTVLLLCCVIFFLQTFDFSFGLASARGTKSILQTLAEFVAPAFRPLGFGSWAIVVALVFGFVAKEMMVSSLAIASGVGLSGLGGALVSKTSPIFFTMPASVAFLIFVMLFSPCAPSLRMIRKEIGAKYAALCAVFQSCLAYLVALVSFELAKGNLILLWILLAIVIAFCLCFVLKLKKQKKCEGCNGCFAGTDTRKRTNKTF